MLNYEISLISRKINNCFSTFNKKILNIYIKNIFLQLFQWPMIIILCSKNKCRYRASVFTIHLGTTLSYYDVW